MRKLLLAALLAALPAPALGWGQEGHAVVGEIAQRHLTDAARQEVDRLLRHGTLAAVASWADDVKFTTHASTYDWHFVGIPLARDSYDKAQDCADGECILGALDALSNQLRCGKTDAARAEALRFVTHLIGDLHQPLHTVKDGKGLNELDVTVGFCGVKDKKPCTPSGAKANLHQVWDDLLIGATVWAWGSYVDRLEANWPAEVDIKALLSDDTGPVQWANESHALAQRMHAAVPASRVIDQAYFDKAVLEIDKQLARGGIRLAKALNAAYGTSACPVP
jgi:hypothetical protein